MSFDLQQLQRVVAQHGVVARVVIVGVSGSAPREVGAAMLVWRDGQSGTIGGGALEFAAADSARGLLSSGQDRFSRQVLGPDLGQCCGGRVDLLTEIYDAERIAALQGQALIARATDGSEMPLAVKTLISKARAQGQLAEPQLIQGWFLEPATRQATPLWIWGAGHVGRALVATLAPLPDFAITWIDTTPERFPDEIPPTVTKVPAQQPAQLMRHAPPEAFHLILSYSHELDLQLCHAALRHGFAFAGLIGSTSKWARFRKRLSGLGHPPETIARITCPIGDPGLGKHPQAIAVGTAQALLKEKAEHPAERKEKSA